MRTTWEGSGLHVAETVDGGEARIWGKLFLRKQKWLFFIPDMFNFLIVTPVRKGECFCLTFCSPGYPVSSGHLMSSFVTTKQQELRAPLNYRCALHNDVLSTTVRKYNSGLISLWNSSSSTCSWRVRHVSSSLILKMKLVPPSLPRSSYVSLSFWLWNYNIIL